MSKISVLKVAEICKKNQMEPVMLRKIMEEINLAVQPDGASEEKPPAVKKQHVVVISDPDGKLPKDDFVAWVVQIPENESAATTLDRIHRAAYDFNTTKKGRLMPVRTVGDAIENITAKGFKEADVWIRTKTPVLVVKSNNQIPRA